MATGEVKKVVAPKGYGFISRSGRPDLFFHVLDCRLGELAFDEQLQGLDVEFEESTDVRNGKPRAVNVRPLKG